MKGSPMRPQFLLKLLAAALLMPILACSPAEKAEKLVLPETFAAAKQLAAEAGKPLLIDFFATW